MEVGGRKKRILGESEKYKERSSAERNYFISICDRCQNSSKTALGLQSAEYIETIFHWGDSFEAGDFFFLSPLLSPDFLTFISSEKTETVVFLARCDTPSC